MALVRVDGLVHFEPDSHHLTRASYSSISLHRACPQKWFYRYGMKLQQITDAPSPYLALGTWWSVMRAVESLERGRAAGSLIWVPRKFEDKENGIDFDPKTVTVAEVMAGALKRWREMTETAQKEFIDALGEDLPTRLDEMETIWRTANQGIEKREQPLGVEVFVERALPIPKENGMPEMQLIGYIDEVYRDLTRDGMIVIRDHKTSKDISRMTSSVDDMMDSQLEMYAWLSAPLFESKGLRPARALAYDRTRSVAPTTPALTASGGLSKAKTNYPLNTYLRWSSEDTRPTDSDLREMVIAELGENAGEDFDERFEVLKMERDELYPGQFWGKLGTYFVSGAKKGLPKFGTHEVSDTEIERLSGRDEQEKWSRQTLTPVNTRIITAHLRAAVDTAQDIWRTQQRANRVGEAGRNLTRQGCRFCDFRELCFAQMVGGADGEYDLASFGLETRG